MGIATAIKARRMELGLSIGDLSRLANVNPATISKYEKGDKQGEHFTLQRLSAPLGIDLLNLPKEAPTVSEWRPECDGCNWRGDECQVFKSASDVASVFIVDGECVARNVHLHRCPTCPKGQSRYVEAGQGVCYKCREKRENRRERIA